MADGLTITLVGGERLEQAFARAPGIVREELHRFVLGATQHLEAEVKDRTPQGAHGLLAQSINSEVGNLADGVLGVVGSPLPYAIPVELGTKPHFPPVQALKDWVRFKLGKTGTEVRRVAYLVARKIAKRGTKGHFMFLDAFQDSEPELHRQFENTVARIGARIGE